jgi:hypothetical protein
MKPIEGRHAKMEATKTFAYMIESRENVIARSRVG